VTPDLECAGLEKRFGDVAALRGVDLVVEPGRFFAVVGPSGCGKSTLLRIVGGHERQDRGVVRLRGQDHSETPPERRPVHTVFQHHALFPHLCARDNVAFPLRMAGVARVERRRRADEALSLVRLPGRGDRSVESLSGGERQRVALARALVGRPALLLLDEPLASLDLPLRRAMQDELRSLRRETGIAFLHVTHDQEEAFRLADTVAVLRGGAIVQRGDPRDVYARPADAFVASFLGVANLLPGRREGDGSFRTRGGLRLPAESLAGSREAAEAVAAFREETVRALPLGAADGGDGAVRGTATDVAFLGPVARVVVAVGAERVVAHAPPGAGVRPGDAVAVRIAPASVVLLPPEPTTPLEGGAAR
jgi:ABC-type Fe3+/spermidine/putrescine transport system ATPase subunit